MEFTKCLPSEARMPHTTAGLTKPPRLAKPDSESRERSTAPRHATVREPLSEIRFGDVHRITR